MNHPMFLVDNNVLSHTTRAQRASAFFRDQCRMPTEVLYEANGLVDISLLYGMEYATDAGVLRQLTRVMQTLHPTDTTLVNLYANKGAGDPMLVACALDALAKESEALWGDDWVVVTDDRAVQTKANEFGVSVMTRSTFLAILEGEARP